MIEPTYENVDPESGEELKSTSNKILLDALTPDPQKKPLAVKLLAVSKARRFANTTERSQWYSLEKKVNSTPDGRLFGAWLEHAITWGRKKNSPVVKISYTAVISYAANEQAAANWIVANRSQILRKKPASEIKEVLEAKTKELDALYNEED